MLHASAIVVLGADKYTLEPVPVLHGYRVVESEPLCGQVDRLGGRGPPYVTCRERFRGRPAQSRYQIKDGEGDHAEHDQQQHCPQQPPHDVGEHSHLLR